jgi:hypothetical protein
VFPYPGAVPAVTWEHKSGIIDDAIVWALDTHGYGRLNLPATASVLYAYRAIPATGGGSGALGAELWDTSAYNSSIPGNPGAIKFMVPSVVDGKILLGGGAPGYEPASTNCPTPSTTVQPAVCGSIAMYK